MTIFLNSDEKRLSEIINELPYGLIDKQVTGIGATHLEMYSERNSIIVVPTRALGENKTSKDPDRFLYVGTQRVSNKPTTDEEITKYLNNSSVIFKKIVVVADSLWRVIKNIENTGIDVYRDYFLMVDEIDTLQSDNHFRPQLSDIIDYYYRFKLQKRALVSATVKDFSHPKLQNEPLTTIKSIEPFKRKIKVLYTNNVNQLLVNEIIKKATKYPSEKILVAYNSVTDILEVIHKLPDNFKNKCGMLCSEASYDKVDQQFRANIDKNDILTHEIVFMTCAFFAGIDIKDKCHIITISNVRYGYTILPINKMTQIAGRCRNGVLSDTIIHNKLNKPFYSSKDYKSKLIKKADKVICLLQAAVDLRNADSDIEELFDRIESVILDKAGESFYSNNTIPLTRKNIDNEFETSYFNIDMLCEQMISYSSLYSNIDSLKEVLLNYGHQVTFNEEILEQEDQEIKQKISDEATIQRVEICISNITQMNPINDKELDNLIRQSKTIEKEYYKRVKELYKYLDPAKLNEALLAICTKDIRPYRSLKNAIFFWALDANHPFKQLIINSFKVGERYSNEEIENKLSIIIQDQLFIKSKLTKSKLVNFLTSIVDWSRPKGVYLIRGYVPKQLGELEVDKPSNIISAKESATKYFKI